jgi:hypothetical protein
MRSAINKRADGLVLLAGLLNQVDDDTPSFGETTLGIEVQNEDA